MIDLKKANEEFDKYVKNYNSEDKKIALKIEHIKRVSEISGIISENLNLDKENIELAKLIGLLHDIGRFEQLRVYHSYNDRETIDHAEYGIEQLFDKGLIKNFIKDEKYYDIIKYAIKYHNKFKLPVCDNERMMMHAKLIRDVDKIDIVYLLGYLGELNSKVTDDDLSPEIIAGFKNYSCVDDKYIRNHNDNLSRTFGYVFDIYNPELLPEIKKNIYYFYKQIDGEKYFKEIYNIVNKYIDERIDNNVRY